MVWKTIVAVALLATAGPATAAPKWAEDVGSGRWIGDTCDSGDKENYLVCMAFLRGVIEGQAGMAAIHSVQAPYCLPAEFDYEQGKRVVAKFSRDNPHLINDPAALLVTRALIGSFPCPIQ